MKNKLLGLIAAPIFAFGLNGCVDKDSNSESEKISDRIIFENQGKQYHLLNYGDDNLMDLVEIRRDAFSREVINDVLYAPYAKDKANYSVLGEVKEMSGADQQLFQLLYINLKHLEERDF